MQSSPLHLPELLPDLFSLLPSEVDLARCEMVCKLWRDTIQSSPQLWLRWYTIPSKTSSSLKHNGSRAPPLLYLKEKSFKELCRKSAGWDRLVYNLERRHLMSPALGPATVADNISSKSYARLLATKIVRPNTLSGNPIHGPKISEAIILNDRTLYLSIQRNRKGVITSGVLDIETSRFATLHEEPFGRQGPDFTSHSQISIPMMQTNSIAFYDARKVSSLRVFEAKVSPAPSFRWQVPITLLNDDISFFHVRNTRMLCQRGFTNPFIHLYSLPTSQELALTSPPFAASPLIRPKLLWTVRLHRDETVLHLHDDLIAICSDSGTIGGTITLLRVSTGQRHCSIPVPLHHTPHMLLTIKLTRTHVLLWQLDSSRAQIAVRPVRRTWNGDGEVEVGEVGLPVPTSVDEVGVARDETAMVYVAGGEIVVVDLGRGGEVDRTTVEETEVVCSLNLALEGED
ncbi:hypothetical protein BC829DRAFT_390129, partial [Chytridium lagenaria]